MTTCDVGELELGARLASRTRPSSRWRRAVHLRRPAHAIASGMPGSPPPEPTSSSALGALAQERQRRQGSRADAAPASLAGRAWRSGCRRRSTCAAARSSSSSCLALRRSRPERSAPAPLAERRLDGVAALRLLMRARLRRRLPAAVLRAQRGARFRYTSSSEIAAGVTPEIREAWPTVSGRVLLELLPHLVRQAAHLRVVEVRGKREVFVVLVPARPRPAGARCSPRTCLDLDLFATTAAHRRTVPRPHTGQRHQDSITDCRGGASNSTSE